MKNILFALLLFLVSCNGTKLMVVNNAVRTDKVLHIERKGILRFGALPASIFIDNEKVAKMAPKSKLLIPVKEGSHSVKIKMFPWSKKYKFYVSKQDTSFLSFRTHAFGIKLLDAKK